MYEQTKADFNQEPNDDGKYSRREVIQLGARVAALIAAVRMGLTAREAQASGAKTSPLQTEAEKPQTPEVPILEELEKALQRMTILDMGKLENEQIVPLSKVETYRLLTGDTTLTDQEIEELDVENPALTIDQRMALWFVYYGGHGVSVSEALKSSAQMLFELPEDLVRPNFIPVTEMAGSTGLLKTEILHDIWKDEEPESYPSLKYVTTGHKVAVTIEPSDNSDKSKQIVSCSFQLGTIESDLYTESKEIVNYCLNFEEVKEILNSFTTIETKLGFSSQDQPYVDFIFPAGKGLEHIAAITVESGSPPQQRTYNIRGEAWKSELERRNQSGVYSSSTVTTDSGVKREPLMQLLITFDDGTQISGIEHAQPSDYDYEIGPSLFYLRQEPKRYGTFNHENSHRAENLANLKQFLSNHSETFFVMALGNFGDVLTKEEVDELPENVLFVGQMFQEITQSEYSSGSSVKSMTIGDTTAGENTLFVVTKDFGVEGMGSSFAVPIVSLITSFLFKEGHTPTRTEVLNSLRDNKCLETVEVASVGATELDQFDELTVLSFAGIKRLIEKRAVELQLEQTEGLQPQERHTFTRRQLLTGAR